VTLICEFIESGVVSGGLRSVAKGLHSARHEDPPQALIVTGT